jgi:tRNA(Ile2)-agmatinylcytidine synthase
MERASARGPARRYIFFFVRHSFNSFLVIGRFVAFIAFDDTDSLEGGCTTHVAWRIVESLEGLDVIGAPELVRLNPNIPFKTRGNAAVCLRVGLGSGPRRRIGTSSSGEPLWGFQSGEEPSDAALAMGAKTAHDVVSSLRSATGSASGLLVGRMRPAPHAYWAAVQTLVEPEAADAWIRQAGARAWRWGHGRGVIGAAAAAAWTGEHDATWEHIAYRRPENIGRARDVDAQAVRALGSLEPATFDSFDERHGRMRAVPSTPCPVLWGVRAEDPQAAWRAAAHLGPEVEAGSLLFRTNQATDDHIVRRRRLAPFVGAALEATVSATPSTGPGGHVFARLELLDGEPVVAAAFEPTKEFRHAVRALRPGDRVLAVGSTHAEASTLALEKLVVRSAAPQRRAAKPSCDACGTLMRSKGRGAGFRCRGCGAKRGPQARMESMMARDEVLGAFEVPVCARRHLSRPLSRGLVVG